MHGASRNRSIAVDRSRVAAVWRAVVVGLLVASAGLSVAVDTSLARASTRSSLAGRLSGLPADSPSVLVDVEAISLRNATVAAVAVPAGGRYSMSVPSGPYLVIVRMSDLRTGRTATRTSRPILVKSARRTLDLTLTARGASVRARETTASGAVVGIGEIPITIDIPGYRPGGAVEEGIVNGLLPRCQADGGRLVDVTKAVKEALKTEQRLSDEGRTAVKFKLNPLTPDLVIEGGVKVDASGKPVADLKLVDAKTGKVVDHVVVAGDPGQITDLGPFLRQIGTGVGSRACKTPRKPKRRPRPSCRGTAPQELCFTFDGSGSAQYTFGAENGNGTESWHMVWKQPLQKLRIGAGGPYLPQAGSTATGHVVIHRDHSIANAPPDCNTDMRFDPARTADNLYNSFSYTGRDRHSILMVATAPMFELGASGSCPGFGGPVDAETQVLHPPAGFNVGAYEQLEFTFSDRPGTYSHTYGVGQHEFKGGGYKGSWTGKLTVQVGS